MKDIQLSAAANLVLLEPEAKGKEVIKTAFKELIARRAVSLGSVEQRGLFGHRRNVVTLQMHPGEAPQDAGLAELRRALVDASRSSKELGQILGLLQRRYGGAFGKYVDGFVMPVLLRAGLIQRRVEPVLWIFKRRRTVLTAAGLKQQRALRELMGRAQVQAARDGCTEQELAVLIASLGPAVILLPELWPQWSRLEQGLHAQSAGEAGFTFSAELEDFDRQCSDVDAAMDASDGGDGGGDGGGD